MVFSWDPDSEKPFQVFTRDQLAGIKEEWWTGIFLYNERIQKVSLPDLGSVYPWSMFAKIEKGIKKN